MTAAPGFHVNRLARLALNVTDLDRSARFYCEALGFSESRPEPGTEQNRHAPLGEPFHSMILHLGEQRLELTRFEGGSRPYPFASRANDLWFQHFAIVTQDISEAYLRVSRSGASGISSDGPQTLPASSGGVTAYKFRDPDGHPLELLQFPGPRTRTTVQSALNTGIDHTALSVSDSDTSTAFYHQILGLSLLSTGENKGPAQDHLDGLSQVAVQVTALTPARATPHIELLGYKTPRGRKRPGPSLVSDIAASRTVFQIDKLPHLRTALCAYYAEDPARARDLPSDRDGTALISDPDGHLLLFEAT